MRVCDLQPSWYMAHVHGFRASTSITQQFSLMSCSRHMTQRGCQLPLMYTQWPLHDCAGIRDPGRIYSSFRHQRPDAGGAAAQTAVTAEAASSTRAGGLVFSRPQVSRYEGLFSVCLKRLHTSLWCSAVADASNILASHLPHELLLVD